MAVNLTPNAIAAVTGGDFNLKPLVQVLEVRRIPCAQERYRVVVSDGGATQQAVLAAQLNERVRGGQLRRGSVVQLVEYTCSSLQNRQIIFVLNMNTIIADCEIIGNPRLPPETDSSSERPQSPPSNSRVTRGDRLNGHSASAPSPGVSTPSAINQSNKAHSFNPTVQPSYKPPPAYKSHGAIMRNEAPARIIPIAALNPYQGRWAIKARVTAKGDIRRYNNAKGDGKVFSFDLLDSDGGEIRVTCFNAVVDRFYDMLVVGNVYLISKGSVKPAQKNFNHLNNQWEILLESASTVELCPDEDSSIPQQQFNFRMISEIENAENNSIIDIIGIVTSIGTSTTIVRKNGMETQRRILCLKDASGKSIDLTLWGDLCYKQGGPLQEMFDSGYFPVLAVKAGKVNDFSGKTVGTISSTQLFIDPALPEAQSLRNWFDGGGKNVASQSISKDVLPVHHQNEIRKTVSQIKDEGLGRRDKPDWVTVRATVSFIKTDTYCYTACPLTVGDRQCGKKVSRVGSDNWFCGRCNQEFRECDYRYLLQVQVQDHTGLTWVTAFQESGEEMLGISAKDLYLMQHEEQNDIKFAEIIRCCLFEQYLFRLKIKEEAYGDEQRVKVTVINAEKVNPSIESKYLLDMISKMSPS